MNSYLIHLGVSLHCCYEYMVFQWSWPFPKVHLPSFHWQVRSERCLIPRFLLHGIIIGGTMAFTHLNQQLHKVTLIFFAVTLIICKHLINHFTFDLLWHIGPRWAMIVLNTLHMAVAMLTGGEPTMHFNCIVGIHIGVLCHTLFTKVCNIQHKGCSKNVHSSHNPCPTLFYKVPKIEMATDAFKPQEWRCNCWWTVP